MRPRWRLLLALPTLALALGQTGCRPVGATAPQGAGTGAAQPAPAPAAAPAAPLPPPLDGLAHDENGNIIKEYSASHTNTLRSAPSDAANPVRPQPLGEVGYVFGAARGSWLQVGADPHARPEGFVRVGDVIQTSQMTILRHRPETRRLRGPVELYPDRAAIEARLRGDTTAAGRPLFREHEFPRGRGELWVPVLAAGDVDAGQGRTVPVAEIATFTLAPGLDTEARARLRQLDLVLVLDATASMQWLIDHVRRYLADLIASVGKGEGLDVRVAVWAYRDHDAASKWLTQHEPLTDKVADAARFLAGVQADQGGDWPEALLDALALAVGKTAWRDGSYRVAIVAGNSPSHEPGDPLNPDGLDAEKVAAKAKERGVVVHGLVVPPDPRDPTSPALLRAQLDGLARPTGGTVEAIRDPEKDRPNALIRRILAAASADIGRQEGVAEGLAAGKSAEQIRHDLGGIPETVFVRAEAAAINRLGFDPRRRPTPLGQVGYERAWVVVDPQAWTAAVLTRAAAVDAMIALLDRLITVGLDDGERMQELWRLVLGERLGEDSRLWRDARLDLDLKARGVPLRDDSVLSLTLGEVLAMDVPARRMWVRHVKARHEALVAAARVAVRDGNGNLILPVTALP